MKINRTELYQECLKTKMGFERWPEWIEQTVTRIILEDIYKKAKKKKEKRAATQTRAQNRASSKSRVLGKYNVKDNYFN